jgi:hypothetical protein
MELEAKLKAFRLIVRDSGKISFLPFMATSFNLNSNISIAFEAKSFLEFPSHRFVKLRTELPESPQGAVGCSRVLEAH